MSGVSRIYGMGPGSDPRSPQERNRVAYARMWHERGVAIIDPADVHDDWARQAVINIATEFYGARGR